MKRLDELSEQAVQAQHAPPPSFDRVRGLASKRRTRRHTIVGAALVVPFVIAVGLFAALRLSDNPDRIMVTSDAQEAQTDAHATDGEPTGDNGDGLAGACGATVPFGPVFLPASSLSGETETMVEPGGTLVVTTRVGETEIQLRWPTSSYDTADWAEPSLAPDVNVFIDGTFSIRLTGPSGEALPFPGPLLIGVQAHTPDISRGCEIVDIRVRDLSVAEPSALAHFGWDMTAIDDHLVELRPLVTRRDLSGFDIPEGMFECAEDIGDGATSGQMFDQPEDALRTFVQTTRRSGFPKFGYHEFVLNTAVHVYAAIPVGTASAASSGSYPVVIVAPQDDGWQVDRIARPGC